MSTNANITILPDSNGHEQYIKKPTNLRVTDGTLASILERICTDNHYHLPIEGNSPTIGNQTTFPAEHDISQPEGQALVSHQAVAEQQPPVYDDEEQLDNNRGIVTRLQETQWTAVQRTMQRLGIGKTS